MALSADPRDALSFRGRSGRRGRVARVDGRVVTKTKKKVSQRKVNLFEAFATASPVCVFAHDTKGNCIYVNEQCSALLGVPAAELLGDGGVQWLHPEDRERVFGAWRAAFEGGRRFEAEYRLRRRDGKVIWVLVRADPVLPPGASVAAYTGTMIDITARKCAESALQESRNRTQAVLDASPLAVVWLDAGGAVQGWSRGAERLFGWAEADVLGQPCPAIPSDQFTAFRGLIDRALRDGPLPAQAFSCRTSAGQSVRASLSVAPLANGAGERVGVVATFDDLTAYEAMLGRLRKLIDDHQRLVQDLHDTCIQSIFAVGLSLEECRRLVAVNPAKATSAIGAAAANLNLVIQDLRAFISPKAAGPDVRDFRSEIARVVEAAGTQTPKFTLAIEDAAVDALTPAQIAQLLHIAREGISNVVRHARARSARVALRLTERRVRLEISDDGRGFDHRGVERRGLGLHHMRARATKLGGRLRLASTAGRGTRLYVDLERRP